MMVETCFLLLPLMFIPNLHTNQCLVQSQHFSALTKQFHSYLQGFASLALHIIFEI